MRGAPGTDVTSRELRDRRRMFVLVAMLLYKKMHLRLTNLEPMSPITRKPTVGPYADALPLQAANDGHIGGR